MLEKVRSSVSEKGGFWRTSALAMQIFLREGPEGIARRLKALKAPPAWNLRFADPAETDPLNFVNASAGARRATLLSDWHRRLIAARRRESRNRDALPFVTLTAVTYNSAKWLPGFLRSLSGLDYPAGRIALIVVDCGSDDAGASLIEAFAARPPAPFESVRLIRQGNIGFGRGQNLAIAQAQTDLVLVTNVDVLFPVDMLADAVAAALADAPDVAAWELRQRPFEHPKYFDPVTLEAAWQSCACLLIRRTAFNAVGGFDPRIFLYGEDVELSYRFRGAGYRLRYLPWVTLTHFVEFGDTRTRPHQLGNSLAANILLRRRYSTPEAATAAEEALRELRDRERDPMRRAGMDNALHRIAADVSHFEREMRPATTAAFPFNGFDYTLVREGYTTPGAPSLSPDWPLPLVTVVTRHYGPDLGPLREAIASVLNQTYPAVEHLIVEDRGDHAAPLVAELRAAYGTNIHHLTSNGVGRSAAANAGLAAARGELMMFLDNDDLLFPDHVETLVEALAAHPDAAAAYAMSWEALTRRNAEGVGQVEAMITPDAFRQSFSHARLRHSNFIPIQAIMFRRTTYEAAGGFDESIDHLEDWHLWNRYAAVGHFVRVPRLTSIFATPADPEIRAARQAVLDRAYEPVRDKIVRALKR